jgi:two-component system chemotaxis response regulator CheY
MNDYEYNKESIETSLEDLDTLIFNVFESTDDDINLSIEITNIIKIFEAYKEFLSRFAELLDLYEVIEHFTIVLNNLELSKFDEKHQKIISAFVKSIIFDLIEFKDKVFVSQEAQNIHYINASIASSCLQIDNILEK